MDQELGAGQTVLNSHKEWTRNWVQVKMKDFFDK